MMKKSLRVKMTFILAVIVLSIVIFSTLLSGVFLGDYYLYGKQKTLVETYKDVNRIYTFNDAVSSRILENYENSDQITSALQRYLGEDFENSLEKMSEGRNVSVLIFRNGYFYSDNPLIPSLPTPTAYLIYSSVGDTEVNENEGMFNDYQKGQAQADVLQQKPNYMIQKMYIQRLGSEYLYLSAQLDNGDNILIRTSLDNIELSVNTTVRFYMYISLIMLIAGMFIVYFISRNFTQPILNLSHIARRMSELDFETKYTGVRQDEIGVLGNSMNYLSQTLESTLAELKLANAKLQKDLEKKIQMDAMRTEFLSNVSHELKTPIALIQGYAEGLVENINDDAESREFYCEVIMDEAKKMNNIVKKLLDLNQLEFGDPNINMEHFDVVGVIKNMLSSSDILFKQKQVEVTYQGETECFVWADVYLVEEVFGNYISNALNHVCNENRISVGVKKQADTVHISVFDTGQPIPEDDLDKIRGKFYKVDKARTREYGGSGVGLSIVKATMGLLGQKYGVLNHKDGVEFWFELDASRQ